MTDQVEAAATPTEDVAAETPKSSRAQAMEAIEASRAAVLKEELALPDEPPAVEAKSDPSPVPDETDKQLEMQLIEPSEKVRVKVKIDGVEEEVPLSDILRNYQKGSAADRRLEEATRLLKEAGERSKQAPPQVAPEKAPVPDNSDMKGKVKDALSRLYDGDEDAAAEALAALIGAKTEAPRAEAPQIDTAKLTQEIKQQLAAESAFEKIKTDYPDVLSDPDLDMLASIKAQRLMETGLPRHEALLAAVKEVAEKTGKGRPAKTEQTTTRDEKLERKEQLDSVKTANVAASDSQAPADDTAPSAVIAAMAAKRLGQSLRIA